VKRILRCALRFAGALVALLALLPGYADAVPAFARQTGENCVSCHVSFPELTAFGRYFKLTGYTLGERQAVPLAMMGQVGITHAASQFDNSGNEVVPRNNALRMQQASVFVAGKLNDYVGGFVQMSYDGETHHTASDNIDLRAVGRTRLAGKELIFGATLHNNPTVQDVWNSTPAFGFPWFTSAYAVGSPVSTLIDGGLAQATAGIGGYAYWNKSLYGELTFYRTSDGILSALRAGNAVLSNPDNSRTTLKGLNPYWRLAYNHDWGDHSLMLGTYGMQARIFDDPLDQAGPIRKYTDTALDFQYQYITDVHTVTAQGTWIHEKQSFDESLLGDATDPATLGAGAPYNASNTLNTTRAKLTYFYRRMYGATLGVFSTTGSADAGLVNIQDTSGNVLSNVPNTKGYILDLQYVPVQNFRLHLQYTGFTQFNGNSANIDGNGRSAKDNNALFLGAWFSY